MPDPIAICIEDLDAQEPAEQYVRCVAVAGRRPGLGLTGQGDIAWQHPALGGCELWVSADERLMLLRPEGAEPIEVRRAGRRLDVPFEKPVVLIHQDELAIAARRYRVHVHGPAPAIHPPTPFRPRSLGAAATLAAAVAIGAPVAGCDKNDIEVRDHPPAVAEPLDLDGGSGKQPEPDASATATATAAATATATATATTKPTSPATKPTAPPIEVRDMPPAPPELD